MHMMLATSAGFLQGQGHSERGDMYECAETVSGHCCSEVGVFMHPTRW